MNVLIIEDEKKSAEKLKTYLEAIEAGITVMAVIGSIRESIRFLNENIDPDIIFLDIQLTDGESFEIFETITTQSYIIFVTAYDQYALKAYNLKTISYLLKPFDQSDVAKALQKYYHLTGQLRNTNLERRFVVKKGNRSYTFSTSNIAYFIKDEVLYLVSRSGEKFLIDSTLERLENLLSSVDFFRINRSCLIHYSSIESFVPDTSHRFRLKLKQVNQGELIVSQARAASFRRWIQSVGL